MFKKLGFAVFMLAIAASSHVFADGKKVAKKESVRIAPCEERATTKDCRDGPHCVWNTERSSCMKQGCLGRSRAECSIPLGEVCAWDDSIGMCQKKPCSGRSAAQCAIGKCEMNGSSCRDKRVR